MAELMSMRDPERITVPFREDLSRGSWSGFVLDEDFIRERSAFWNVPKDEYAEKMMPIMNLDPNGDYVLCFGEDACCRENLAFMLGYLKTKGRSHPVRVRIVDELTLALLRTYTAEM